MDGESKRDFALALASFAIGAAVAGVLSHPETRARITEGSKYLVKRTKRLGRRAEAA
jgi:hypothetical protein